MAKAQTGADLKEQFEPLSEADIQASTDDKSYQKGYDYYLNHNITEPTLSESVIRALCHGSSRNPYRVEAVLLPAGEKTHKLTAIACSCPRGGFCKHLVALLLTWLHQPESFVVRAGLIARLSMKSHEELVALLEQLIQRQRDIEPLIEMLMELPLAAATAQEERQPGKGREVTVDLSAIHRQVSLAFDNAGDEWDSASDVAYELERVYEIGKSFAEAGQWANALFVYSTIAEDAISQYEDIHDEGDVSWTLGECATGLVECLTVQSSLPEEEQLHEGGREELLTALFTLWKFGYDYGGIEVNIPGAIAENATKEERGSVEKWLRQEIEKGKDSSRNSSVVNFLVTLKQVGDYSEEDVLEEYRDAGLYRELTEKLLAFNRIEEALGIAQANLTESRDVTWFAEQLLKSGETWPAQALTFVETRLKQAERALQAKSPDYSRKYTVDTYRHWLSQKYVLYGKTQQALDMELARFQAKPDETTYESVRSVVQGVGQSAPAWSDLRPRLVKTLEQQRCWDALVSIYLKEGEVGLAITALAEVERTSPSSSYSYGYRATPSRQAVQVAQAAEEQYPDDAIRLYKLAAQTLISGKSRESYQQATGYLVRVKKLYQKQGQEPGWQAYITDLRKSNKSLRALKEELDKKGL